ncbi:MAG: hypothetical protein J4F28_08160 [Nitrosopumilaceae archaeon]|nr:hypothetical protein [Nitrosopumilaceae archaeon]
MGGGFGVEVVCGACGVVKDDAGEDGAAYARPAGIAQPGMSGMNSGGSITTAGNRPNLYLEMEVGGKPDRTLRGDRYVHRQADLAVVSNIAQKLGIPNNVGMTVWQWYRRLRKELKMTKAKCLVLAFFATCRHMGCPILEGRLSECIRMELGVRNAHSYLRVVMDASSYMTNDGEMVLRKCGFLNMVDAPAGAAAWSKSGRSGGSARMGGIPDAVGTAGMANAVKNVRGGGGSGDVLKFALGTEVQSLAEQYESEITNRITGVAKRLLPHLSAREKNPRRAARIAVRMARQRVCGTSAGGGRR